MRLWATVTAAVLLAACGDSTAPTMSSVAGSYAATSFTVTESGGTTNILAAGGSITLTLTAAGVTSGRLFVPGGAEDGGDFDEALTGTWTLQDSTVTLEHDADTFLRDMSFTVRGQQLVGEETFSDVTVAVVFTK
jgi:hypothetical protein